MKISSFRDEPFLTEREAARMMRLGVAALQRWRVKGSGPPFLKINRTIRYSRDELLLWLERQTSTAKEAVR